VTTIVRSEPLIPVFVAAVVLSVVLAAALGEAVWAAALGSGLVVVYWLLERLFARLGSRGSFGHGMAVGVAGMAVRLALVVGVLIAIGLAARDDFATAALAFLGTYTIYMFARLWHHPAVPANDR
jgi:hypothetical protein